MKQSALLAVLIQNACKWFSLPKVVMSVVLPLFFFGGGPGIVKAQDHLTSNYTIYIQPGAEVFLKGDFINNANGVTENAGAITIDGNWVNNGAYSDTVGTVIFSGADQDITGTSSTAFNNLTLQGSGLKTLTLDATVSGVLSLNDRELSTDSNTLFVTNTNTGAITVSGGFVSSLGNGSLSRETNGTFNYLFPVGSSLGTQRYRPVVITPNSSSAHTFTVGLANTDATAEGFDRSLKDTSLSLVNPDYFHRINRTNGTNPADVSIYFDDLLDNMFRAIAHWQTLPKWKNTGPVTTINSLSPVLSFITKAAWDDFSYDPFALALIPDAVTLTVSNSTICEYDTVVFNVTSGFTNYAFYVNAILAQSGTDSIFLSDSLSNGDTVLAEVVNGLNDTSFSNLVVITVNSNYNTPVSASICANDSIFLAGAYQSTAGVYYDTLASVSACDSIVITTLTIDQVALTSLTALICPGDSIFLGGSYQNSAGTYYDTATSVNGCDSVIATTLVINTAITMNISVMDASCNAAGDGSAIVATSGGIPPYTYLWSDGQMSSTATALDTGNYTIAVTDSIGCTATDSTSISASNNLAAIITGSTDASCSSICNGIASAFATGGTAPYSYLWDDPLMQTSSIANTLCTGINNVIVTDALGCSDTAIAIIGSPLEMELTITTTSSTCNNTDGSATVGITNGLAPYTYYWSSGDTLSTADSLSSGIHIVTVIDGNGCSTFTIGTVSDLNGPVISVLTTSDITCNSGSDGVIGVGVSGGTAPYTYQWSDGSASNFIYDLVAGPYELTVVDSIGCEATTSLTLVEPDALSLTITTTDANCSNANGAGTVGVTGGTPGYSYLWSSGGTSNTELGLIADVYTVTVTDVNNCNDSINVAISSIGGADIVVDSIIDGGCGADLGSIYITLSGGAAPYTYLWSDTSTAEDLIGVSSGIYNVTVTDTNGCVASASAQIHGIPAAEQEICLITVDSITQRNLVVWEKSQLQGVMSYNIYKESTQIDVYYLIGNVPVSNLSEFVDSLSNPMQRSWRYKISVLDSCGNESELSANHKTMHLTLNVGLNNTVNLIWDHYIGFSFTTYYIYRYTTPIGWEKIDSLASNLTSYTDFSPSAEDLYYQVVAKPPTVCIATKQKNFNSSKSNTSSITLSGSTFAVNGTATDATQGICDGSATVTAIGGTMPYTYIWDDTSNQTTATATGLCGNQMYTALIMDNMGDTVSVSVLIGENVGIKDVNLNDGISIFPNPNTGKFKIEISAVNHTLKTQDISVYNIVGQKMQARTKLTQPIPGNHIILMDLSEHPPGIYFLHIVKAKNTIVRKILVE